MIVPPGARVPVSRNPNAPLEFSAGPAEPNRLQPSVALQQQATRFQARTEEEQAQSQALAAGYLNQLAQANGTPGKLELADRVNAYLADRPMQPGEDYGSIIQEMIGWSDR